MIQTLVQQAVTPAKPFSEVWGPSIIMGSVGLMVGLTSAILAYRVASRGLTNILNAQSDKHRKDLEREAINARRVRNEKRMLLLVDHYSALRAEVCVFLMDLGLAAQAAPQDRKEWGLRIRASLVSLMTHLNRIETLDIDKNRIATLRKYTEFFKLMHSGRNEEMAAISTEIVNELTESIHHLIRSLDAE